MAKNRNQNQSDDQSQGRGWHGDSQKHAQVGAKGGRAAQQSGNAHQLTDEERSRGGQNSPGQFQEGSQRAREAGRKGGSK
ncbi:MAG TPA: hypothetical protein VF209_01770 [Patescibacteria group bacterium]